MSSLMIKWEKHMEQCLGGVGFFSRDWIYAKQNVKYSERTYKWSCEKCKFTKLVKWVH